MTQNNQIENERQDIKELYEMIEQLDIESKRDLRGIVKGMLLEKSLNQETA